MKKIFLGIMVMIAVGCVRAEEVLRLATTTSTYETGLLDEILPPFEKAHDVKIHVISVGTGKAIRLGKSGDVDVIMVHARQVEDKFVSDGYGVNRKDLMYNDFVMLGPADDPAAIAGSKDCAAALKKIAWRKSRFVSRGDDSGTHKKELAMWKEAELKPEGEWYMESGQGMSASLRMADEKNAYVLVDRSTYISNRKSLRLKVMVEGDPLLRNPYGVIAVNPKKHPHVKFGKAMDLIKWLTSKECGTLITDYKVDGEQLFHLFGQEKKRPEKSAVKWYSL